MSQPRVDQSMEVQAPQDSGFGYLVAILMGWRWVLAVAMLSGVIALAVQLLMPNWYTSSTSFIAESQNTSRLPAGVAGIASQLGINVGTELARSPDFYAALLVSEPILDSILLSRFPDPRAQSANDSSDLLDLLHIAQAQLRERLEKGRRRLLSLISVAVDPKTSIITLNVEARSPTVAAAVGNQFLKELSIFDVDVRHSQAKARRDFAAKESENIRVDLASVEDSLRRFYERNREYRNSPSLVFEESRLRRQVDLQQELYLSLRRELEAAKVEAVNDAPSITVLAPAVPPTRKSRPHRLAGTVAAALLGATLAALTLVLGHRARLLELERPGAFALLRFAVRGKGASAWWRKP